MLAVASGNLDLFVPIVLSATGLREQAVLYKEWVPIHFSLDSRTDVASTSILEVSLAVEAAVHSLVWGTVASEETCSSSNIEDDKISVSLGGAPTYVIFTTCDVDHLPVDHELPHPSDRRELHARIEELPQEIAYLGNGRYAISATPKSYGAFNLTVQLEDFLLSREGQGFCKADMVQVRGRCGCREGYFQLTEADPCEPCFPARWSSLEGALGRKGCNVCAENFYLAPSAECRECPNGAICPHNTTLETMRAKPGFWRLSPTSSKFYLCDVGQNTSSKLPFSPCSGGTAGSLVCIEGHTGPLCRLCADTQQYYKDGRCNVCPSSSFSTLSAIGAAIIGAAALATVGAARNRPFVGFFAPFHRSMLFVRKFVTYVGFSKLKQLLIFAQISSALDNTFHVDLPQ